jgi:hypothetical protein
LGEKMREKLRFAVTSERRCNFHFH